MITPELKDRILRDFIDGPVRAVYVLPDESAKYDLDYYLYSSILDQFERLNFLRLTGRSMDGFATITVTVDAHDFIQRGGFTVQEEILKANIQKLGLEIDQLCKELSPDLLEKAQKLATLGTAILSALKIMCR